VQSTVFLKGVTVLRISGGRSRELARVRGRTARCYAVWPAQSAGHTVDGNMPVPGAWLPGRLPDGKWLIIRR